MKLSACLAFILFVFPAAAVNLAGCSSGGPSAGDAADGPDYLEVSDPAVDDGPADIAEAVEPDGQVDAVDTVLPDESSETVDIQEEDAPPVHVPLDDIDHLRLYINIGDSLAAGYDASGENSSGGKGYARLMVDNHPDYPSYAGHHLAALFPGVEFRDLSHSGDTSDDALDRVRDASWPPVDGDVLVSLTCGGNDFNDDIQTMILRSATEAAAANLQANYREIVGIIRGHYENPAAGHVVVFLITNVHDPTGGTGAIPPEFTDDFCATLNDPRLVPLRATAIENLGVFNSRIVEVILELGGCFVDNHGVFFDHGMNAPGDGRWITNDCVHPSNEGHHQLRREEWFVLTGERY